MAFDRQAALQAGYTEEEIDSYLQNLAGSAPPPPPAPTAEVGEPPAPTTTVTPAGEGNYAPTAATAGLAAASLAGPAALYYGGKKIAQAIRGPVAPTTPTPPGATQNILNQAIGRPGSVTPPAAAANPAVSPSYAAPSAAPAAQEAQQISRANQIVRSLALDKLLKGSVGAGAALYSPGLNTNESQELARRRGMPPTITGQ